MDETLDQIYFYEIRSQGVLMEDPMSTLLVDFFGNDFILSPLEVDH
jgi:hypothetical protein